MIISDLTIKVFQIIKIILLNGGKKISMWKKVFLRIFQTPQAGNWEIYNGIASTPRQRYNIVHQTQQLLDETRKTPSKLDEKFIKKILNLSSWIISCVSDHLHLKVWTETVCI